MPEEYFGEPIASFEPEPRIEWPSPTPSMLSGDKLFDAIWSAIKTWDINVPGAYTGYMGATGNHARAVYDAIMANATKVS